MDSDIEFGQVEQVPPQTKLRPDRNRHLAVVPVESPADRDMPIFVDLDAMRDMVAHSDSDQSVELGGVMLGGQFVDESGQAFVVITDSLRARHYESTKGSFKFTHETWEQITRERDAFPAELQMVGWYHTHPDWGVFLSGLDLFICDHFFNKPLDVALVIDPCRRDAGFFQWTGQPHERIRRTAGFHLTASRFREEELREFAAYMEGKRMPQDTRVPVHSGSVIHLPPPPPAWPNVALFGMLTLQFCFLMVIGVRLLPPTPTEPPIAAKEFAELRESIDRLDRARQTEADIDSKLQVLEQVVRQGGQAPEGVLKSLAEQTSRAEELRNSLRGQQSLAAQLDGELNKLKGSLAEAQRAEQAQRDEVGSLQAKLGEANQRLLESRDELEKRTKPAPASAVAPNASTWWSAWVADGKSLSFGFVLGAIVLGAAWFGSRKYNITHGKPS